jgi:Zn finger protein HypA/HybF involved in hydrogenase expression
MNAKCPICGKTLFKEEFEICSYCGWEHDLVQEDDVKFPGGSNDLSLVEYKKLYELILNEHPKYTWINDRNIFNRYISNFEIPPYLCKCCNSYEVEKLGEQCPNCGWIDSQLQNTFIDVNNLINKDSLENHKKKCSKKESD